MSHLQFPSRITNSVFLSITLLSNFLRPTHSILIMFSKLALFAVASMAVFVAAAPADPSSVIENSCNSGPIQCCMLFLFPHCDEFSWLILLLLKVIRFSTLTAMNPTSLGVSSTLLLDQPLVRLARLAVLSPSLVPRALTGKFSRLITVQLI